MTCWLSALTDSDEDHSCVCEALRCVKELITAVDSKVNEQEKKQRLKEVYRYASLTGILFVGCAEANQNLNIDFTDPRSAHGEDLA